MFKKRRIYIDFDGVISNSNHTKASNISTAYLNIFGEKNDEFVDFFTSNNGIPRESKLSQYFGDEELETKILEEYERLNKSLLDQELTDGVEEFLALYSDEDLFVLSGGNFNEISQYLRKNNLDAVFEKILAGPDTKSQHLSVMQVNDNDIFIGDSKHDYMVAKKHGIKFIFLYKYSQETLPLTFLDNDVEVYSDFVELLNNEKWKIKK